MFYIFVSLKIHAKTTICFHQFTLNTIQIQERKEVGSFGYQKDNWTTLSFSYQCTCPLNFDSTAAEWLQWINQVNSINTDSPTFVLSCLMSFNSFILEVANMHLNILWVVAVALLYPFLTLCSAKKKATKQSASMNKIKYRSIGMHLCYDV